MKIGAGLFLFFHGKIPPKNEIPINYIRCLDKGKPYFKWFGHFLRNGRRSRSGWVVICAFCLRREMCFFSDEKSAGLPHKVSASVSKDKNTAGADHSAPAVHLEVKNREVN